MKTIYLAGGCFWGLQKFFDQFDGIVHTEAGYANGPAAEPSYRDVCAGSGHAETVRIDYDENRMDLDKLLEMTLQAMAATEDLISQEMKEL